MTWTPDQLASHPKVESLLGVNTKKQEQATQKEALSANSSPTTESKSSPEATNLKQIAAVHSVKQHEFTVSGPTMGKPRMSQRDRWQKRPVVLRYREYCDRFREESGTVPANAFAIIIRAYINMPPSWTLKKQAALNGTLMQQRPDWDNIGKTICDALFEEDSMIAGGICWKQWCAVGQERCEITVLYLHKDR